MLQKDYPGARAAFERSLMTIEKRFGPDHFDAELMLTNSREAVKEHQEEITHLRARVDSQQLNTNMDLQTTILLHSLLDRIAARKGPCTHRATHTKPHTITARWAASGWRRAPSAATEFKHMRCRICLRNKGSKDRIANG